MSKPRPRRTPQLRGPYLLAGWQRALLWLVWLGFFGLCIANSDRAEMGFWEFGALGIAVLVTACCWRYPAGPTKILITSPELLRGEFVSRTNWPLVLLGLALTLGGLAGAMKIGHDWWNGFTTVWGVLEDFALFFIEMFIERISKGTDGDVTHAKMYILVFLLPIGPLLTLFNLLPWIFRGHRFRVSENGQLTVRIKSEWRPLALRNFQAVAADGITINFAEPVAGQPSVTLPQSRVYSRDLGTPVEPSVLADFFRQQLEQAGFSTAAPLEAGSRTWVYRREA